MAAVAVQLPMAFPRGKPIITEKLRSSRTATSTIFDPDKHLNYVKEPEVLTMKDISLPENIGISHVAVSQPFPLFSEEAIRVMRDEIFSQEVWDNCMYSTDFAGCQLRGHCPKYAPFMHQAWKDPKLLSIISKIAQVDLVPVYDIEIGNINISVQTPNKLEADAEEKLSDEPPVTKWHNDSYPFVCVVMMSDASAMRGGETALKCGTGEIIKVRGPQMGCAVVLQGRCISHQALAAIGGTERITMVTSFRPRDGTLYDSSVLTTIRPLTEGNELYFQWTQYRIEVLQERLRKMQEVLEEEHRAEVPTDIKRIKQFLKVQEEWLVTSNEEIIEGGCYLGAS